MYHVAITTHIHGDELPQLLTLNRSILQSGNLGSGNFERAINLADKALEEAQGAMMGL